MDLTPIFEDAMLRRMEVERINIRRLTFLCFLVLATNITPTFGHIAKSHHIPGQPKFTDPREVVRLFLKAVDRGGLIVFDQRLDRSMITPVRVEYVYDLDSLTPRMKVYSDLKHPVAVPGHPDCRLHGVSAVLDNYGQIIEVVAHVWPEEPE